MKKIMLFLLILSLLFFIFAGCADITPSDGHDDMEGESQGTASEPGPAPNSGDGVPDGPGWK